MSAATINSAGLWAHQKFALGMQRPLKTSPVTTSGSSPLSGDASGGGLFADLVAALTGGAVTFNGFAAGTGAGSSGSSGGISAASTTSAPSSSAASRRQIAHDVQEFTQSLRQALASIQFKSGTGAAARTPGASASVDVANLNAAYSKLAAVHGVHGVLAGTAARGASNVASSPNTSARLRGLLQSLLQHVQQQGSWAASAGRVVHVVA